MLTCYRQINGEWVQWKYYKNLYEEDCNNPACLRVCPKLTKNHIFPTNCLKMRVSLATQVCFVHIYIHIELFDIRRCGNMKHTCYRLSAIASQQVYNSTRKKIHHNFSIAKKP